MKMIKIKRGVVFVLIVLMFFSSIPFEYYNAQVLENTAGWNGTDIKEVVPVNECYTVDSAEKLAWFSKSINSGNNFENKKIEITGNINLNDKKWTPIGDKSYRTEIKGEIVITNCIITGLNVQSVYCGLFGNIKIKKLSIYNFTIENAQITNADWDSYLGVLAGILEISPQGTCLIDNSDFGGKCKNRRSFGGPTGGIIGNLIMGDECQVNINGVKADFDIKSGNEVGSLFAKITDENMSGKMCISEISIENDLEGYTDYGYDCAYVGGIIGSLQIGEIDINKVTINGNIYSHGYFGYAGGIIGHASYRVMKIKNVAVKAGIKSDWRGVYGYVHCAGGFLGYSECKNPEESYIQDSYIIGNINSGVAFCAHCESSENSISVRNCYFDKETTGMADNKLMCTNYADLFQNNVIDSKGLSSEEMKNQESFKEWNFDDIWTMGRKYPELLDLPYDNDFIGLDSESLGQYLDALLTNKGNVSTIKYLAIDENFTNSAFVYKNDAKFSTGVAMTLTDMLYRGMDGWKDIFNGETAKQQAEEVLAKLLYNYQNECEEISYVKTAKKYSSMLTSGLEDFMQADVLYKSISNKDIKNLNESLSPETLSVVFKEHKYNNLENYLEVVKGYSKDDETVKLLNSYLQSENLIKSYKNNFKYLGAGIDIIQMGNDTLNKLYEFDVLYNSGQLYSEMLLYIKNNCKYEIVSEAAEELYRVINGAYQEQLLYVTKPLLDKLEEGVTNYAIDKLLETSLAKMKYAFIIKEGFDWGVKIANLKFHTGESQELRDKMRTLAYLGNCLAQWMLENNIAYLQAETDEEREVLGLKTYYAAYMLWQTRSAGEDALQGFAEKQSVTFKRYYQVSKEISSTLASLENTMFTKDNTAKLLTLVVACPVDVEVLDKNGNVIKKIMDGEEKEFQSDAMDYSVVYDPINKDYIKIIHFCEENTYKIRCVGTDIGQVDLNLMKIHETGKCDINYIDDIGVKTGTIVELPALMENSPIQVNDDGESTEYNFIKNSDKYIPLKSLTLRLQNIEIYKGDKVRLDKEVVPVNASDKMFYWNSDNEKCVKVNGDGVIQGIANGQATISVSSMDGKINDTCIVTVIKDSSTSGEGTDDSSNTSSGGSSNTSVSESNSGENSGSSDDNSAPSEKQNDDSTIKTPGNQSTTQTVKYSIIVPSPKIAVGNKVKLIIKKEKNTLDSATIKWSSDNTKYATVNAQGIVIGKKEGIGKFVTIIAKSIDEKNVLASVKIKIMKHAVTKVQIKVAPKTMKSGESAKLQTVVVTNGKLANTTLKWKVSNAKYASVNKKGKVVAEKAGKGKTVIITAISTDGTNKKASVKIKIK